MMTASKIEWCTDTWNPVVGCTEVSTGCKNCYAKTFAHRLAAMGKQQYAGLTVKDEGKRVKWTGELHFVEAALTTPLATAAPRIWFVNSMGDLFHEDMDWQWIDRICAVMALCPQHVFQTLTKRPEIMQHYLSDPKTPRRWAYWIGSIAASWGMMNGLEDFDAHALHVADMLDLHWPPANMWWGTSCENQETFDKRAPALFDTPAAVRFISFEPLLGPINLGFMAWTWYVCDLCYGKFASPPGHVVQHCPTCLIGQRSRQELRRLGPLLGWGIVGGESGSSPRPMNPRWATDLRDELKTAGIPFFFKQWGRYVPIDGAPAGMPARPIDFDGENVPMVKTRGKADAGRLLDGQEYNETPLTVNAEAAAPDDEEDRLKAVVNDAAEERLTADAEAAAECIVAADRERGAV